MIVSLSAQRAGLLCDAAQQARAATDHLLALAGLPDLTRDQKRRLRCLAGCTALAAEGADRLRLELAIR